ncbi:MAG TPA: Uma2 family endonuclease [Vicinamibacteria bacterium]|nr:Uma2 family endonuclease [Vicinamibacteria bacterium]
MPKRATYEDVLSAPENKTAEILGGELFLSPRPAPPHVAAHSALQALLHTPFDQGRGGPGGWRILVEPELHLGDDVLVPDVAGWRRERMPALPATAWFELSPDWLCEVLSPSTESVDRGRKLPIYAAAGVAHVWLVNPIARTLEVMQLREGERMLVTVFTGDQEVRPQPFETVPLSLAALWDRP